MDAGNVVDLSYRSPINLFGRRKSKVTPIAISKITKSLRDSGGITFASGSVKLKKETKRN